MSLQRAFIALNRFGYGARAGETASVARNVTLWLDRQINPDLVFSAPEIVALPDGITLRAERQQTRSDVESESCRREQRRKDRIQMEEESAALIRAAAQSDTPLIERLTAFWANHFTVSVTNPRIMGLVGLFQREVIRPHLFGRFEDMLIASCKHPAMLIYLDQVQSIGPNSLAGRRRERGLNENLAREILELHTLGVDGGYMQQDVEAFARALTGWTIDPDTQDFIFRRTLHEPGAPVILGKNYPQGDAQQGEAILRDLARHPATARFIARKLAQHFIADDPPASAISGLASTFHNSGGDLAVVTRNLVRRVEAWNTPLPKVKTHFDWLASVIRISGHSFTQGEIQQHLTDLGQPPFAAPSPAGWADEASAWLAPEALGKRIDLARSVAEKMPRRGNPAQLAEDIIGSVAHPDTLFWIAQAPDFATGMTLLLASAEFQRR